MMVNGQTNSLMSCFGLDALRSFVGAPTNARWACIVWKFLWSLKRLCHAFNSSSVMSFSGFDGARSDDPGGRDSSGDSFSMVATEGDGAVGNGVLVG